METNEQEFALPKFKVGQKVVPINEENPEVGTIQGFVFANGEYSYQVTSKEVDIQARKVLKGIKTYREEEIKDYE